MTTQTTSTYLNQPTRDYLTARAARLATKLAAEREAYRVARSAKEKQQ